MKKLILLLTILFLTTLSFAQKTFTFDVENGIDQKKKLYLKVYGEDLPTIKDYNLAILIDFFVVPLGVWSLKQELDDVSFDFIPNTTGTLLVYKDQTNDSIMTISFEFPFHIQNQYGNYIIKKATIIYKINIFNRETQKINEKTFLIFIEGEMKKTKIKK